MSYDITFCPDKRCTHTECHRHRSHTPVGRPYSMFVESPKKDDECKMYWPGWVKPDGRKAKK